MQGQGGNVDFLPPAYGTGEKVVDGGMVGEGMERRRGRCCGAGGAGYGYGRKRCRGPVRAFVGYLIQ